MMFYNLLIFLLVATILTNEVHSRPQNVGGYDVVQTATGWVLIPRANPQGSETTVVVTSTPQPKPRPTRRRIRTTRRPTTHHRPQPTKGNHCGNGIIGTAACEVGNVANAAADALTHGDLLGGIGNVANKVIGGVGNVGGAAIGVVDKTIKDIGSNIGGLFSFLG